LSASSTVGECFANETGYLVNGKFNKELIAPQILSNRELEHYAEVIKKAIDTCAKTAEAQPNVNEQLVAFEFCLRTGVAKDCAEFHNSVECDPVQRFFEDCRRPKANCDVWPKRFKILTLSTCCNKPDFFGSEDRYECEKKCWLGTTSDCAPKCSHEHLSYIDEHKNLNLSVVKAKLKALSDPKVDWTGLIDKTIDQCDKLHKEAFPDAGPFTPKHLWMFADCVDWHFDKSCIDFGEKNNCYSMKKFKEQCPETMREEFFYDSDKKRTLYTH
jgi:hypothetical protein